MAHEMSKEQKKHDDFFKLIQNKDWKNPIKTVIDPKDFDGCYDACIFFTGSELVQTGKTRDGKIKVQADGYYIAIGS